MRISIIIVNYNGQHWLKNCLDSIFRQKIKGLEIIFVDNHSTDDSLKIVKNQYPSVVIIQNKVNLGFGQANNLGAQKATGEFLLFLNTDTKLKPHSLSRLVHRMVSGRLDLAGPKLLDFENRDFYQGRKLTLDIVGSLSWGKNTTMIEGCCLMIRKNVFDQLGGFDPSFFMYSEDLDLCWRAWLKGFKIKLIPESVIYHFGGGSSLPTMIGSKTHQVPAFRRYETEKNTLRMMLKNATPTHLLIALPLMFLLLCGEALLYLMTGQANAAKSLFKSLNWNLANLPDTLRIRQSIHDSKRRTSLWPKIAKKITKFEVFRLIGIPHINS